MTDTQHFYIGIDGGGTRCRARITDAGNQILGEAVTGSANVFQDHHLAWHSVQSAIFQANEAAGLSKHQLADARIVAGLAGAEVSTCAEKFRALVSGFRYLHLLNDAQIACLGAHLGQDGAVYIIGTGAIGFAYEQNQWRRVGGWGFPLDDIGSGAWLGQQAVRAALQQHDGVITHSAMTRQVWESFDHSSDRLLTWSMSATSADYGQLAPMVTLAYENGDLEASKIVQYQIAYLTKQIRTLVTNGLSLSLMGGLSDWLVPLLPNDIKLRLTPSQGDALTGALRFAQRGTFS